jgi:quercetin dioxygenase-like cupin family protein
MRSFNRLLTGAGGQLLPIYHKLTRLDHLWNEDMCRTTFEGTPHEEVDDILLRFGKPDGDDLVATDRVSMSAVPEAKAFALTLMQLLGGSQLGRMVVTRLPPGGQILPHSDVKGAYCDWYSRYHIVLHAEPGVLFACGEETVQMVTGEVWWFDAHLEHWIKNNSKDDRVHMLVDIRIDP